MEQISCNGGLWRISRRFSDFDQLHSRLARRFGDLIEAQLPEKQWFGRCVALFTPPCRSFGHMMMKTGAARDTLQDEQRARITS